MIGFRVLPRGGKVDAWLVEGFAALPVSVISDSMHRMFAGNGSLRPLHRSGGLCGPAITVRTRPGDNLMLHKAIDLAEPGDVIVVDGGGDLTNALIGELMIAHARRRGVAGVVVNGAVRDSEAIGKDVFPVFAKGITHRGPYKDGPGEINVEISIDGMVIAPGDLVVGDRDGILAIPSGAVEDIYNKAAAKQEAELRQLRDIAEGTNDRTWVDKALIERGCAVQLLAASEQQTG